MARSTRARLSPRASPDEVPVAQKVAALREPGAYPAPPRRVDVVETHMAWVFLTEQRAFKLKKPVKTATLDFSTAAARRRDCEREVALNRPLAGGVYRGVVPLAHGPGGTLRVGGLGPVADWLVAMRRLSAGDSLETRIATGTATRYDVERAVEWLTRFYDAADPEPITGPGYRRLLADQLRAARDELLHERFAVPAERVRRIAASRLDELTREAPLFDERARSGRIIDAHGDLRPEHIFVRPLPVVIDCLEFRRDLRLLDPVSELGFLGLECERLGAPWVGGVALATYSAQTGDAPPARLVRFYRAAHALTRAVVALWHLDDPGRADGARFRAKALTYLDLAEGAARA